jgi:hypothetical protein
MVSDADAMEGEIRGGQRIDSERLRGIRNMPWGIVRY